MFSEEQPLAGLLQWRRSGQYEQLDTEKQSMLSPSVSSVSDSDIMPTQLPWERERRRFNMPVWLITVVNAAMLSATIFMNWPSQLSNHCVKQTSSFSPILNEKSIKFHDVRLNGTLWPGETPSWSRKEPGDSEAEAQWESFENMPTFPLSRDDVVALGKDPNEVARYPDEVFGLGDDAYIGSLDSLHKMHCLNELRKMTFEDYGNKTDGEHGRLWWVHLRHCVDMLAQDLLCHADADIITYRWVDTQEKPFPDFSLNRRCRSMDPLLDYMGEHQVDQDKYVKMKKPTSGLNIVPMDPGYYVAYGFALSEIYPDGKGYNGPWPDQDWAGIPPHKDTAADRWEGWAVQVQTND